MVVIELVALTAETASASVYLEELIVTAPALSVMVTLVPAVKANVSLVASVLPPAVTGLHVLSLLSCATNFTAA